MKFKFIITAIASIGLCTIGSPAHAAFTLSGGKLVDVDLTPTMPVEGHFNAGMHALEACNWDEASKQFRIAAANFPASPYGQEANYYLGVAYYNLNEYDFANTAFSDYLKAKSHPRFFQETMEYKFKIAENFRLGAKRRFFGTKQLPKWASGNNLALEIYDEVIACVPCHELAARALYSKGQLLWSNRDYRQSIDCFQMLAKRFPKHELAPECYLLVNKVYLDQCQFEFQNPDILAFSQINLRKFQKEFPREERLSEADQDVLRIKEVYAKGLYETGQLYERKGKPKASIIYYSNAVRQFPETEYAELCRKRLYTWGRELPLADPAQAEPDMKPLSGEKIPTFNYQEDDSEDSDIRNADAKK